MSHAQVIVDLFAADGQASLFHNRGGETFATFLVGDHRETWPTGSRRFRRHLQWLYYRASMEAVRSTAVAEAQATLEAHALYEGAQQEVYTRIAGDGIDVVYVDLCDDEWRVVEISVSARTFRVLDDSPVRFVRAQGMLALPVPEHGGNLLALRELVNIVDDGDWALVLAWLVAALRPIGPYPILLVHGEQGTAKSMLVRIIRRFVDPNRADLRAEPRNTRDLAIAASNAWVMGFDNLSSIEPWLSDALCRLSTGGGFATRQLYTDREEAIFESKRPVVLTGIEEIATRGDLIDRCISIELQPIFAARRRTESEIWAAVNASAGRIFGALLDAVAYALRAHRDVRLPALPRMADFATWATAAEPGLGLPTGAVMAAYQGNRAAVNQTALESSEIATLVIALVGDRGEWSGTAKDLLQALEGRADDWARRGKGWPRTARAMAGALRRVAPNMRKAGIRIEFSRAAGRDRQRVITMSMAPPPALEISAEPPKPVGECPQAASDDGRATTGHGPTGSSDNRTKEGEASDDPDGSDDVAGAFLEDVEI
ncbi:MAG: ATP-binding protein [Polyangia bacterium]